MRTAIVLLLALAACDSKKDAPPGTKAEAPAKAEAAAQPAVDPQLHDDFDKVCNARVRSGADASDPEASVKVAMYIQKEVKSAKVIELLQNMAAIPPAEKGTRLRAAAKAAGVDPCPLADEP